MAKQETFRSYHHNETTQFVVRLQGLIFPTAVIVYGVLVRFGIVKILHPAIIKGIGNWDLYIISFLLLAVSVWQIIYAVENSRIGMAIRLIAFHILMGAFLVFVTGIISPFIVLWLLLSLQAYTYFPKSGVILNTLGFLIVILADILVRQDFRIETLSYDILALIIIEYTSFIEIQTSKTNVVERKELNTAKTKEALQRERIVTIINNLADAIISTDTEGIIRVSNSASLSLLNTNSSIIGRHIDSVLPVIDLAGKKVSIFDELHSAKTAKRRDDLIYSFSDDDKMRLEIIFSPVRRNFDEHSKKDVNLDGYVAILRDVTKAKSLEEERDEFISVTSHELRTPITVAEGALSNVKAAMTNPNAPKKAVEAAVETAYDQITFLSNMVNDLNALSRAERNVNNNEKIDVRELANKLFNKYSDEAKAKQLSFDLVLSPNLGNINTNRLYIEEILQNLVTNAIKYTKEGGIKFIVKKKGNNVQFTITDTGIGISRSDQSRLFGKFYRSENYRTRETGGTGMGLYISAKLASRIGTKIQFASTLNKGSSFWFEIKNR